MIVKTARGTRAGRGALWALIAIVAAGWAPPAVAGAGTSATVIMYHRFGEKALPATNIRIDQFEAHIAELKSGPYTVMALADVVAALGAGRRLPERTVAITIDDAFTSVYREAWPRLRAAGLPFTLFVATDAIDRGGHGYMSWDQLRELAKAGVTIGSQTASHPHLPTLPRGKVREEFARSNARFKAELGFVPTLQAYPYGEASRAVMAEARAAGFTASFGQHSGVADSVTNPDYLPRFAMNEHYGDLKRFRMAANALPLFATDVTPSDPTLTANPPAFGFTVGEGVTGLGALACYSSAHGKLAVERLGRRRIEVRPPSAFPPGRARINCTLPAGGGRWRWFGQQFFIPRR